MRPGQDSDFDELRKKIVPAAPIDTVLQVAFGSGFEATQLSVGTALQAYVTDLRERTGALLVESVADLVHASNADTT